MPVCMIMGDFNLLDFSWDTITPKSHSPLTNELIDFMNTHLLPQFVNVPTRKEKILDLCLSNHSSMIKNVNSKDIKLSDHKLPVVYILTDIEYFHEIKHDPEKAIRII